MRINTSNKSEIFDIYSQVMDRYNKKYSLNKTASLTSGIIQDVAEITRINAKYSAILAELGINNIENLNLILTRAQVSLREGKAENFKQALESAVKTVTNQDVNPDKLDKLIKLIKEIEEEQTSAAAKTSGEAAAEALRPAMNDVSNTIKTVTESVSKLSEDSAKQLKELAELMKENQKLNKDLIASFGESFSSISSKLDSTINESISKLESTIKASDEAGKRELTEQLTALKALQKELKESSSKVSSNLSAAKLADNAVSAANFAKKSYGVISGIIKILLIVSGAGAVYWYFTKDETAEEDVRGSTGESSSRSATQTRDDEDPLNMGQAYQRRPSSRVAAILDDETKRVEFFDSLKDMDPDRAESALESIAKYYNATGYIKLSTPVVINNETIEYVFPMAFRGGRDPVRDTARRAATEEYFTNLYTQDSMNNRRIKTRIESTVGSSDAQKIANYAFSVVAGGALFSGKGTPFGLGDRGRRYGRGKENVGVSDFGIAGTSRRRMTREERRMAERGDMRNNNQDFILDNSMDLDDPMSAFASGINEIIKKNAKNIDLSTNSNDKSYNFDKKADKFSNRYFKDAIKDLEDDEFMKEYYAGFSKLHNQKSKKQKEDYSKLYDLHDETGSELIHKSHPKAISVAEAIGGGGLVENLNERSKSMQDAAKRNPSGNYRARYVSK